MSHSNLPEKTIHCPYCGENITLVIDDSIEIQEYIEDCQVCCCPITIITQVDGDYVSVTARHENE